MDVVDLYRNEVTASEPQDDFYDRHYLYGVYVFLIEPCLGPNTE